MPRPSAREYMRSLASGDALAHVNQRLLRYSNYDPLERSGFPDAPAHEPQAAPAANGEFGWSAYDGRLDRPLRLRVNTEDIENEAEIPAPLFPRQRRHESPDPLIGERAERGRDVPDAVDSYISDPPLAPMQKTEATQTMDDMSFLSMYSKTGSATLTVLDPYTGKTTVLRNLNLETLELISPVLALSFEESRSGSRYSIEDVSLTAVLCMLRHIYTCGPYVPDDCVHDQLSVLLHIEIFHLATVYDIDSLKTIVKARMFLELELSTSYPGPPKDLCRALAYAYKHLPNENDISKTLAHYCITCFLQHRLNEDELFTTFHYDCRPFQRDLCVILRENGFEDESAPTLIRLPVKKCEMPTRWPAVFDADPLSDEMLDDEFDDRVKRRTNISRLDTLRIHFRITLPSR